MTEVKEVESFDLKVGNDSVAIRTFSLSVNGVTVEVSNVGASITKFLVPNFASKQQDVVSDVVLGYKSATDMYSSRNPPYLAVVVGRVANRIARGQFSVDGKDYIVATNNGPNHLHGGGDGFSHRIWDAEIVGGSIVQFTLLSEDGDQGYPGTVQVTAKYLLVAKGEKGATLKLEMVGTLLSGDPSPINLAQHTYFNLAGHNHAMGILDQKLTMPCEAYTPVNSTSIPTREVRPLDNDVAMDWRSGRLVRDALVEFGTLKAGLSESQVRRHFSIKRCAPEMATAGTDCPNPEEPYGFDHNYVVHKTHHEPMSLVGTVEHADSGRRLTVFTDAPGVQLYTANWLDGSNSEICKDDAAYGQWQGLCLETQTYPDGILGTDDDFPEFARGKCFILRPGGPDYVHQVEYHVEPVS
ncbi:Aldose 1-epimerase [Fragilaria crotonensis]|nr:Aldose 1-epimerase [Fragilaria crotonensis]